MNFYTGHTDCVRGLATNKDYFFSCSNDGTVIQWQLNNPNPIKRYNITESFIYSIFASNNIFVTSGEDRSLRIHDSNRPANDSLLQTLVLPSQSLWNCICLPNNDIVVACSDGTVRIFTQDESRTASKSTSFLKLMENCFKKIFFS
jgi:phospholipase A-2-activating protein